jgi:molybdopterin/thiamine biosynthesis adenylyltransferase
MLSIVVLEDLIESIKSKLSEKKPSIALYGRLFPEEKLCQVLGLKKSPDLGEIGTALWENGEIHFSIGENRVILNDIEAIPYQSEFTSRAEGIVDTTQLARKRVVVVGTGSVGSSLAVYLAESSVGRFRLIDPDRLSASNVSRHAADIHHLGRFKTRAVKDLILARNPQAQVETFEEDFLELSFEVQMKRLGEADLVIAATDSNDCQFMINEVCLHARVLSLYVGCYQRAQAGEIVYVIPGETPCFRCLMEFRARARAELDSRERRQPYRDGSDGGFKAEPGLAIDIGYMTSVAASFALALLAPDPERQALLDPARNLVMFHAGSAPGERYAGLFTMPFDYVRARTKRDRACEACLSANMEEATNAPERTQSG